MFNFHDVYQSDNEVLCCHLPFVYFSFLNVDVVRMITTLYYNIQIGLSEIPLINAPWDIPLDIAQAHQFSCLIWQINNFPQWLYDILWFEDMFYTILQICKCSAKKHIIIVN